MVEESAKSLTLKILNEKKKDRKKPNALKRSSTYDLPVVIWFWALLVCNLVSNSFLSRRILVVCSRTKTAIRASNYQNHDNYWLVLRHCLSTPWHFLLMTLILALIQASILLDYFWCNISTSFTFNCLTASAWFTCNTIQSNSVPYKAFAIASLVARA